jgi:hypothetical protein
MMRFREQKVVPGHVRRPYRALCGALLAVCLGGIAVSLVLNVGALAGIDWKRQSEVFWICQGMLIVVYLPICIEMILTRNYRHIFQPRRWQRRLLSIIALYYVASFYWFLYRAADNLQAHFTWQMVSAGMILAFSIAAIHYSIRYSRSRTVDGEKNSAVTVPST